MMNGEKSKKQFLLDKLLILLAIICVTFAVLMVGMYLNKAEISIFAKNANEMKESYASTESNIWDISEAGDGSVTATLDENGLLTISGTGNMKDWKSSASMPWYSMIVKIKQIKIEEGITSIGRYSFMNCYNSSSIEIPSTVTNIGDDVFVATDNLIGIEVNDANTHYMDDDGILYTKDNTTLIKYPGEKQSTEYEILEGTQSIESDAFCDSDKLIKINIPEGVTNIGSWAFARCDSLTNIEIPNSVTNIGLYAFQDCDNLTGIQVRETNVSYMDDNGVLYTKDKNELIKYPRGKQDEKYTILDETINIKTNAFSDCISLKEINIPSGVISIGGQAFIRCNALTEINIPASVTNIGGYAFSYCSNLNSIKVNENNQKYYDDNGVLYTKDKTEIIKYPEGKQEGTYTILNETTSIDSYAFSRCSNLKEVIVLEGVNNIKSWAFEESGNLIIICKNNTVVQNYAQENNINYISTNYNLQRGYIKGIHIKTTYENFINNIKTNMEYSLQQEDETVTNTSIIKTGQILKIGNNTYTMIVTGDADGDGLADISDILAINKHRLNKATLTEEYLQAADVDENGQADIKDILQINKFRLGKTETL